MSKLIKADIDRVLRRKSLWFLVIAVLAIVTFIIIDRVFSAPDQGFAFAAAAGDGMTNVGFIVGLFLILNIYSDDFKSMTFINVIGRGLTRMELIIAKLIDTYVIMVNMYLVSGIMVLVLKSMMGISLSPMEIRYIVFKAICDIITTTASIIIAAVFFYMTENTVLGVIAYIFCEVIIPLALDLVIMIPRISKFHLERIFISGITSTMMADFMIGNILEGIGLLLLINVFYIGVPVVITILLFNKKELDF